MSTNVSEVQAKIAQMSVEEMQELLRSARVKQKVAQLKSVGTPAWEAARAKAKEKQAAKSAEMKAIAEYLKSQGKYDEVIADATREAQSRVNGTVASGG